MRDTLAKEITDWLNSPERAAQIDAARYLAGKHDILTRERRIIGKDGRLEALKNLPNNLCPFSRKTRRNGAGICEINTCK